jgi:hypothetical protein
MISMPGSCNSPSTLRSDKGKRVSIMTARRLTSG